MNEEFSFMENEENQQNNYDNTIASIGDVYKRMNLQKDYFQPGVTQPYSEIPEKFRENNMKFLLQDKQKELIEKQDYSINTEDQDTSNLINFNINEKIKMDDFRTNTKYNNEKLDVYPHIKNLYLDMASEKPDNNYEMNVQFLKTTKVPQPKKYSHVKNGRINHRHKFCSGKPAAIKSFD